MAKMSLADFTDYVICVGENSSSLFYNFNQVDTLGWTFYEKYRPIDISKWTLENCLVKEELIPNFIGVPEGFYKPVLFINYLDLMDEEEANALFNEMLEDLADFMFKGPEWVDIQKDILLSMNMLPFWDWAQSAKADPVNP